MGWFDDNHWAGEAYNFGMGYMAQSGYSGSCADPYVMFACMHMMHVGDPYVMFACMHMMHVGVCAHMRTVLYVCTQFTHLSACAFMLDMRARYHDISLFNIALHRCGTYILTPCQHHLMVSTPFDTLSSLKQIPMVRPETTLQFPG